LDNKVIDIIDAWL